MASGETVDTATHRSFGTAGVFGWYRAVTGAERHTFWACYIGHALDAMDTQLYSFVIPALIAEWGISRGQAGQIASAALLTSAAGGWIAGIVSDRIGRVRTLQITIAWFALFSLLSGLAQTEHQLLGARMMLGLGFGGETAVGAILIAETINPRARGRAVGLVQSGWSLGSALAALASTALFTAFAEPLAWRLIFAVGVLPSLLILLIRRNVAEPPIAKAARAAAGPPASPLRIFARPMLRTTLLATLVAMGMLGGNYVLGVWLPTFLKTARGLSVLGTGSSLLIINVGAFCGYLTGSYLADRIGRKRNFVFFAVGAMITLTIYTNVAFGNTAMLFLGLPLGFFSSGILAGAGSFFSELFPTQYRGSGQGFCFNSGRALGAMFPWLVGFAGAGMSLQTAIGTIGLAPYVIVLLALLLLPETRGRPLDTMAAQE